MSSQPGEIAATHRVPIQSRERAKKQPAISASSTVIPAARGIAYLVSEYPKVSHSFIRREILALERRGWSVERLSVRKPSAPLVDPSDVKERQITQCVLGTGALSLTAALVKTAIVRPSRFWQALSLLAKLTRGSDKPLLWHLIYLAEACWISTQLMGKGIRHLHAHFGTNPAEVAMLASMLSQVSYSFTVHGPEEFDRARHIHLGEKIARAHAVIAISSFGRSQLYRAADNKDWEKIHVVHCGIDNQFREIASVTPSASRRLACVGRLCEQKGHLLLIEAIALLARQDCLVELVLVGDGELRKEIERKVREYDLGDQVRITGWASADQVKREMLSARAVIMPSFAEGLPVVLMEAMALGRPVLSTYIAGIPELVEHQRTGWLFPAGSVEHMAEAVRRCLDASETELKAMGEAARARALERHDIDREAEKLASIFEVALGGSSRSR